MRWRVWLIGIIAVLVTFCSCYQLVTGNTVIPVVFTGLGVVLTIAQFLFKVPLRPFRSDNIAENTPALSADSTSGKKVPPLQFLSRLKEKFFNQFLPKVDDKAGLAQSEGSARMQQERRSEALKQCAASVCLLSLCLISPLFAIGVSLWDNAAPRGSCTILTRGISLPDVTTPIDITPLYYQLQFTFRLQTNTKEVYLPVAGQTVVSHLPAGEFETLQEAQQQLTHYLIGKTYPCQYTLLFHSVLSTWLISDKPISSDTITPLLI